MRTAANRATGKKAANDIVSGLILAFLLMIALLCFLASPRHVTTTTSWQMMDAPTVVTSAAISRGFTFQTLPVNK